MNQKRDLGRVILFHTAATKERQWGSAIWYSSASDKSRQAEQNGQSLEEHGLVDHAT